MANGLGGHRGMNGFGSPPAGLGSALNASAVGDTRQPAQPQGITPEQMTGSSQQPEVIVHQNGGASNLPRFQHPTVDEPDASPIAFPNVATSVDRYAKKVPWWVWFVAGAAIGAGLFSAVFRRVFGFAQGMWAA